MRYLIEHDTRLEFPEPVREHHCELRVVPRGGDHQTVHSLRIEIEPEAEPFRYIDCFGNVVHHFGISEAHDCLRTHVAMEVETSLENPFDYAPIEPARELAWLQDALHTQPKLWDFVLHRSDATPNLRALADKNDFPSLDPQRPALESVQEAMLWIRSTLAYDREVTVVNKPLVEVLEAGAGACQDFAHLLIALVRSWGLPARYAMGYQDPSYLEGDEGREEAVHAWSEVLIPGAGWRGFDATNGLIADHTYVRVAVGRDSRDAAPQRGSFKGDDSRSEPIVHLRVQRQQQQQ